jgi:hypothetical protein
LPGLRPLGPALGLTPSRYQSGETDRRGAITKAGDARARIALFEAAHVMMTRVARWFPLKAWAMRVAARRGAKRAKVALARRLAVILHRMWVDGTDFLIQGAGSRADLALRWGPGQRASRSFTQTARGDGLSTRARAAAQRASLKIAPVQPPHLVPPGAL